MKNAQPSTMVSLGIALVLVATALLVVSLLMRVLPFPPHITFVVAITLSALAGGIKAGLLSLLSSIVAINYFFVAPVYALTLGSDDLWRLGLMGIALVIASRQRRGLQSHKLGEFPSKKGSLN